MFNSISLSSLKKAQQNTLGIFSKALASLKEQNTKLNGLTKTHEVKVKKLQAEITEISEMTSQNNLVIENINQFLGTKK